jgi:formylglycine-generating enzyme required for sulfatase activity
MAMPCVAAPDYSSELIAIPGGTFRMGSADGDRDERPVREVAVEAYRMGRTEVTVGWYLRCMADGACQAPTWWSMGYFEETASSLTAEERARLPVTGVSWRDARDFCRWLGPDYDLPTEAEWEHAAGAAGTRVYPWGNDARDRIAQAGTRRRLMPAASAQPGPHGLHDLAGGAWEWTLDCYDPPRGDAACLRRVTKGGSWSDHTWNLRVANKSHGLETAGYKGLGFRVVRRGR